MPEWAESFEPRFKVGQEVFYITFDDNCPAALNRGRVGKDNIRSIKCELYEARNFGHKWRDRPEGELVLVTNGYVLHHHNFNAPDGETYLGCDLYETEEEAQKYARWHPVEGITDEQWMLLTGHRETFSEDDDSEWARYFRAKDAVEVAHEKESKTWIHHIEAEPIDIEESEIGVCCASISQARDYLLKCAAHGGLIYRDVLMAVGGFIGCGDILDRLEEFPILKLVCDQLKIEEAVAEIKSEE